MTPEQRRAAMLADPAWATLDEQYATCPLLDYAGVPGTCRACGAPLPRTKAGKVSAVRRWCGPDCTARGVAQHVWPLARAAALKRDGWRCVCCGALGPHPVPDGVTRSGRTRWAMGGGDAPVEVNHRDPRRGEGYRTGCAHHLANLETLCRACHTLVTVAQRRARAAGLDDRLNARQVVNGGLTLVRHPDLPPPAPAFRGRRDDAQLALDVA